MNSSDPTKGSLEELFRHHLLESEAAAVRPRPQVWEQVDTSLLLAQNEKYRRRLLAYRWAMAASLLLTALAGGGWWRSQHAAAGAPSLAQATTQPLPLRARQPAGSTSTAILSSSVSSAIDQTSTLSAAAASGSAGLATAGAPNLASRREQLATTYAGHLSNALGRRSPSRRGPAADYQSQPVAAITRRLVGAHETRLAMATSAPLILPDKSGLANATQQITDQPTNQATEALPTLATLATADATSQAAVAPTGEQTLAARWVSLSAPMAALPNSLAEVAVAPGPPLELTCRWQYGLAYAASAYQPNIDWTRPAVAYNTALGLNSASLTRSAAAEYRDNLRPGLGQRLSLWATRRLGNGRWSLRTGLEVAQNTATSASSVAFVGEPVADVSYTQAGFAYTPASANSTRRLQRTSFRYRSVSVPAELRYSNPLKTGFSFYGRVGAFVSALLNVHSEVDGSPEAARTYTLQSASTPYRPYSGGLRGGLGMQYRPAGHQWSLNVGPVAEFGIWSLNANPSQDFWSQQRPYSFGLEAGMELGRGFRLQ